MAQHTTNYTDTFIAVAPDCPATVAEVPPERATPSVARIQYDMLADAPYAHTSDDVVHASQGERRGIDRDTFFAKGQACLRASPLVKRYGWGLHHDAEGRVALVPVESTEYAAFLADDALEHRAGMRSSRA
ncbi:MULTISPECIES: DUF6157 family protein [unclassified Aeromicrobium]|jgi:hypothetical protein|uniref:DUF6157 family protein n=1 Tax=unclassified Aeromicrobium TaxID=2633570 RepID=UPI00288B13E0|nr:MULTISPECIES: DUF6157 family protein [unclassified Aeromicrobium]